MNVPLSPAGIIGMLGKRFREYRLRLKLTQKDVADQTLISIPTIYKFENGRLTDMSTANLFKLLRVVGITDSWDSLLPELPESPYMYKKEKKIQRIRHTK